MPKLENKKKFFYLKYIYFKDHETALHCAVSRGHIECVQSLLENGSPLDLQDEVKAIMNKHL